MSAARGQIIEATCELLELQGYHATGLNQIVKESGSPKGSLYHYFPGGKDELTAEALQHVGQIVLRRIHDGLAEYDNAIEAVRRFIVSVAHNVERSGFRAGGPITTVAMETAATNERLRAVCEQIYSGWRDAFAARLMADGYAAPRAARLAAVIIAAIEGGIILCRTGQDTKPLEDVALEVEVLLKAASATR